MSDIADRVRTAIHNPLGHAQGGTLGELVEAAVMGMHEAGVLADLEAAAAPSSVREGGATLRLPRHIAEWLRDHVGARPGSEEESGIVYRECRRALGQPIHGEDGTHAG